MNEKALEAAARAHSASYAKRWNEPDEWDRFPQARANAIEDMRAAISSYEAETGWRSMDSAPQIDGQRILAEETNGEILLLEYGCLGVGCDPSKGRKGWFVPNSWQDEQGGYYEPYDLRRWQPLPAAPSPEQETRP